MDNQFQRQLAYAIAITAFVAPLLVFLIMPEYGPLAVIGVKRKVEPRA